MLLLLFANQPYVPGTPSLSPSGSLSPSPSVSPSASRSPSSSFSASISPSSSLSPSASASASRSPSASYSPSSSTSASASPSLSPSASVSPSASISPSASRSPSASVSPSVAISVIPNFSFEDGTTGWAFGSDFTRVNTDSHHGMWSAKQVSTGASANLTTTNDTSSGIPVDAGRDYILKFWAKIAITSGLAPIFNINKTNAFGTTIASVPLHATGGLWEEFTVNFNTGAETKLWLRIYNNGGTVTAFYDQFELNPAVPITSQSASLSPSSSESASASPSAPGSNTYLNFRRSVDIMKKMKDSVNNQLTTAEKTSLVNLARDSFANYIAFSVPLATQSEFLAAGTTPSPRTIEDEWLDWANVIHGAGLGIIYRSSFPGMEAIWGFQRRTGVNRFPAGSLAEVLAGDHNSWCGVAYDWVVNNAACFRDTGPNPDVFGLAPERTESSTTTRTITSITRVGSIATVTTSTNHDLPGSVGSTKEVVKISGVSQSGYNGSFLATKLNNTQFTIQVAGSPATPATPSSGSMVLTYGYSIYDDALSPIPNTGAGTPANYAEFYKQLNLTLHQAAIDIGKPGLITGDTANNYSEVRSGWLPQTLFNDANRVTFDYYLNYNGGGFSANQAMTDAEIVYTAKGNKRIAWQEYGPTHSFGQPMNSRVADFQDFCNQMLTRLVYTGKQEEMNFWVWWEGQNTSFLNKSGSGANSEYSLNPLGEVMKSFFRQIVIAIGGEGASSPSASISPSSSESPSLVSTQSPSASSSPSASISPSASPSLSASASPSPVWTYQNKYS